MAFDWFALDGQAAKSFEFRCGSCGELHRGAPSFAYDKPVYYFEVPEAERGARVHGDADTCVIDDELFFIRTILEIPIIGSAEPFTWGVWVSQSQESFARYLASYDEDQSGDGSFGWLAVTIPGYGELDASGCWTSLACDVAWGDIGQRPSVHLQAADHPLYIDQREGISWDRAIELARLAMHRD